ncbi:MAG TPA: M14 family metallopeptidase [Bacteroidales bacterium]|nr:M14 family metallopeptidase [Bacteroidales bacterium]HQI45526.1 M14 family metallopeptidase [Bacteroidales bacterium]
MIKRIYLITVCFFVIINLFAQSELLTIAEESNFLTTSKNEEVIGFINQLKKLTKNILVEKYITSTEGYEVPLLIIADPLPILKDNQYVSDGRTVVYIQANIHAGEVEGKEACLMLARDILTKKKKEEILKNIILLICPNFNPDGNQKISKENRKHQNGPLNGVGLRYNGQMLDINRDALKAETPEMQVLLTEVLNKWDPAVFVDCHTTNGSYHEEPITFTWMSNGNTDRKLINYMRDEMMPAVSKTLSEKYKTDNCFYGEFKDLLRPEKGWESYAYEPRYLTNYIGLRNRLAILNENYVYADYKTRVLGCYNLLWSILEYTSANSKKINMLIDSVDFNITKRGLNPLPSDSFAITFECKPTPEKITIKAFEVDSGYNPNSYMPYIKTERKKTVTVPYYADYFPKTNIKFPFAYIINIYDKQCIDLLLLHGIKVEKLKDSCTLNVESFIITELSPSLRLNQGHYTNSMKGTTIAEKKFFAAGTYLVRTAQPLANIASYLLEPQLEDGMVYWNYFDKYLVPQWGTQFNPYPVYKVLEKMELNSILYLSK